MSRNVTLSFLIESVQAGVHRSDRTAVPASSPDRVYSQSVNGHLERNDNQGGGADSALPSHDPASSEGKRGASSLSTHGRLHLILLHGSADSLETMTPLLRSDTMLVPS